MKQKTKKLGGQGLNARKLRTLDLFEAIYPEALTPAAYARQARFQPVRAAYSYLKRLESFGLLVKMLCPLRYKITAKGKARLAWLRLA